MRFQKALKEAIKKNQEAAKRLDEATTNDFVNNWPILVAGLIQSATGSNSANKSLVSNYLSQDITLEDGKNTKWTGELADIIERVKVQNYSSSVYDINSTNEPITKGAIQIPPKSIMVDGKPVAYASKHPAVVLLVNKIDAILKSQKGIAGDLEAARVAQKETEADRIKRIQQQGEINSIQRKTDLGIG